MKDKNASSLNGESLHRIYGMCLLRLGKSSVTPLASLGPEVFEHPSASGRFLRKCKELYDAQPAFEKRMLRVDVFERGAHYPYWFLPEMNYREYGSRLGRLLLCLTAFAYEEKLA